jgi:glycosyltransferase involved in cell wall biosynthesis
MAFPKTIHQIWIGPNKRPDIWMDSVRNFCSNFGYEYVLWDDAMVSTLDLINKLQYDNEPLLTGKSDVLRYELLNQFGGIYIDADMVILKPEKFNDIVKSFSNDVGFGYEVDGSLICGSVIFAVKGSLFMKKCIEVLPSRNMNQDPWKSVGTQLITDIYYGDYDRNTVTLYPSKTFYPIRWHGIKDIHKHETTNIPEESVMFQYGYSTNDLSSKINSLNPKIGLCMIVKNESHIIRDALMSTLPLIDTFCILDTGSTDDTVQIIRDFYKKHNIDGIVIEGDWKGFGKSRSEVLKLCDGRMDYCLMIDADDVIILPTNGKELLKNIIETGSPNAIYVHLKYGELLYERLQIFRTRDNWKYVGVLHEYPTNDKPNNKIVRLPKDFYMNVRTMGSRSIDTNKYQKDAETLLKGLEDEPTNVRYMFYLAQSYKDCGNIAEAVKWYKKRYEAGGWFEEMYISAYQISRMTHDKEWVWKAHEVDPRRIEAFHSYIQYHRSISKFTQEIYAMALHASNIKLPDNALFVESSLYEWKIHDELSIIAYYTGHKDVSLMASNRLLSENKFPEDQRERILKNKSFST